jgi:hypothetical protein
MIDMEKIKNKPGNLLMLILEASSSIVQSIEPKMDWKYDRHKNATTVYVVGE